MISEGADNGNGRVTLAVLGAKSDEILRRLDNIDKCQQDHEKRLSTIEQVSAKREEQITNLKEDISNVRSRDNAGTIAGIVTGIIAGVYAFFKP